jgi:hypothetical protein
MATNNYLKVHRKYLPAVELFFDANNPISVASAHRAAHEIAGAMTGQAQAEADTEAAQAKVTPKIVDATAIAVWTHGVQGLGDLHCIGGCELCAPRPDLAIVESDDGP